MTLSSLNVELICILSRLSMQLTGEQSIETQNPQNAMSLVSEKTALGVIPILPGFGGPIHMGSKEACYRPYGKAKETGDSRELTKS